MCEVSGFSSNQTRELLNFRASKNVDFAVLFEIAWFQCRIDFERHFLLTIDPIYTQPVVEYLRKLFLRTCRGVPTVETNEQLSFLRTETPGYNLVGFLVGLRVVGT